MDGERHQSDRRTKWLVTLVATAIAAAHVSFPSVKIDEITLALVFIGLLPWLIPYLRSHVKGVKFLGQEVEFLERKVDDQAKRIGQAEERVREAQEKINTIVTYSLAFYLFEVLRRLYEGAEFKFERKGKLDENLRLLRHLGYLEFFITSELREGDNLSEKLKLTPLGRMLVELREEKERENKASART